MSLRIPIIGLLCFAVYMTLFINLEEQKGAHPSSITPALPTKMLDVLGHTYLTQFIAEVLFIKTAVYQGGLRKEPTSENLTILGNHFIAMSHLHPKMIDIYYRAESTLAHRGEPYIQTANQILKTGRTALPNEVALPFLEGFNYFNYLNNPLKAAEILKIASEIPAAPKWIGHLASILMAREGNIRSGLALLQGMYANSQNSSEKERYQKDIIVFKQALLVQQALDKYRQNNHAHATDLSELVPIYLGKLPTWNQGYSLDYHAPKLLLVRRSN